MPKGVFIRSAECNRINSESKKQSYANGRINANKGKKFSEDHRLKLGASKIGENNPMWKGGITKKIYLLRMSSELKIWREKIFLRDKFTCKNPNCPYCKNKVGGYLHAHHLKSFTDYPELRFNLENGITYCLKYHKFIHSRLSEHYKEFPHV